MKQALLAVILIILSLSSEALAQNYSDAPNPDEPFSSFFARITRGGGFPGIYLEGPQATQAAFLKTIKKGYWVGQRDLVHKELSAQGVNLWGEWFQKENTFPLILNNEIKNRDFSKALTEQVQKDFAECSPRCPEVRNILGHKWKDLDQFSRQEFIKALIFSKSLFGDKALIEYLAELYNFPAAQIETLTKIRVLSTQEFENAVREAGYDGPIYFRGITTPDAKDPNRHTVLLNGELLYKNSPFDSEILKTMELVGILVHELSHVFQDLKGNSLGLDVQVRSAEAALLLEGSAEFLAEKAMRLASEAETPPSALKLFVAEQAVEIVYREGNESTGRLFPYTVGLPFSAALYLQTSPDKHTQLTEKILQFLSGTRPLKDWLTEL
jgi:hypothetical protein